jgi:IclR family transcriptional regulator, pca regulon regulatory protein
MTADMCAYATSMGRVLLAGLDDDELDRQVAATNLHSLTSATLTTQDALRREVEKVRRQGWAIVDQELEVGLRSAAAPIRDPDGRVVAAVNVSAHPSRTSLSVLRRELLPPLLEIARDRARPRHERTAQPVTTSLIITMD